MEKTQKVIVVLLILAILFSVVSIVISLTAINVNIPDNINRPANRNSANSGEIGLSVEANNIKDVEK